VLSVVNCGWVFTTTNEVAGNRIIAYETHQGRLDKWTSFPTGGAGTGASLSSQFALKSNGKFLFTVNAGTNSITAFRIKGKNLLKAADTPILTWTSTVSSQGVLPVSIAANQNFVFVLNAGNSSVAANIAGFWVSTTGILTPISGSVAPLSVAQPGPAEIAFTPSGNALIVTEKATSKIDTYLVNSAGAVTSGPNVFNSSGNTPYGFDINSRGIIAVTEAVTGAVSTYTVNESTGTLTAVSWSVSDGEGAACWLSFTKDGNYAFASNAATNSISSYGVSTSGVLWLARRLATSTNLSPIDNAFNGDGDEFYVLDAKSLTIESYFYDKLTPGALRYVSTTGGTVQGGVGLVAW